MNRCSQCLMSDTRPDTPFIDGWCSACVSFRKRREIDWGAREGALIKILDKLPKNDSGYDCIVPSSGGKDSHWQVLKLIELGIRPLVVTATTCHLTPIGRRNIDNLSNYATTVEYSPNKTVRAKLNRLSLELVGDISWPEHVSIFTTPFRAANDFGIDAIFYGENPQEAYGGPIGTEQAKEMTKRWVSEFGGFLGLRPADLIGMDGITTSDMLDYVMPGKGRATAYFLGHFYEWDSHGNARVAMDSGMESSLPSEANWWPWENLDNMDTFWHDHGMYRKYGYGRLCAQISVDVRLGRISREDALEIVRERDGIMVNEYLGQPVSVSADRIGMTQEELILALDGFTNWSLFDLVERDRPILKEAA